MSLRDQIKELDDIQKEVVHVPQWDMDIEVRGLSGQARSELLSQCMDKDGVVRNEVFHPGIIIYGCYDSETGARVFETEDKDWLLTKSSAAIDLLVGKILRLSGMAKDSVKEAEKNLPSETRSDTTTSS